MPRKIDPTTIVGNRYNMLQVLECVGKTTHYYYRCLCECGRETTVCRGSLLAGTTKSCGCLRDSLARERITKRNTIHGESAKYYYVLWESARARASRKNIPFTIKPEDIVIPTHCPVLGLELKKAEGRALDNSPSVDRIDSTRGYEPDNICVISNRANMIKAHGTAEEHRKIAAYIDGRERYQEKD